MLPTLQLSFRNVLLLNIAATPGLGTFLIGRRLTGALQMAGAYVGAFWVILWLVGWVWNQIHLALLGLPFAIPPSLPILPASAWAGFLLFAAAWLFSLGSALAYRSQSSNPTGKGAKARRSTFQPPDKVG